jgi:hypothetical protein
MKSKIKSGTFGSWIETLLIVILFVGTITIIGVNMNQLYGKDHDLSYGIVTNDTLQKMKGFQGNMVNNTQSGQSSVTDFGIIKLTTIPSIINFALTMIWEFVSGGFINRLVELMNLGSYASTVIIVFKLLYFITIGFIFVRLILRVNP